MASTRPSIDFGAYYSYRGKNILITGSVGTVGSEVLRQLLQYKPQSLRLFDNNESGLFLQAYCAQHGVKCIPILGDIRDIGKLQEAMDGMDAIFHLAAFKHVTLCESNPFDAVRTNVIGTQNVLKAALSTGVKRLIYTSSDKAVNPTNVMGTSKLLAERVVTAASLQTNNGNGRVFSCTRFGNVLGSNGSVIPIFKEQIRQGGPVTVTHPEMSRFIMTVPEAARLVVKSGNLSCGGEVMVTKMPVLRIADLAQVMIELLAPVYGYDPKDIPIEYIGPKPGEKLYEELMTEEETGRAYELSDMYVILPAFRYSVDKTYDFPDIVSHRVEKAYISKNEPPMTPDEIKEFLLANDIAGEPALLTQMAPPPLFESEIEEKQESQGSQP